MYLLFNVNIFFGYFIDIVMVRVVGDRKIKKSDFFGFSFEVWI
jgi:hypothetical protein